MFLKMIHIFLHGKIFAGNIPFLSFLIPCCSWFKWSLVVTGEWELFSTLFVWRISRLEQEPPLRRLKCSSKWILSGGFNFQLTISRGGPELEQECLMWLFVTVQNWWSEAGFQQMLNYLSLTSLKDGSRRPLNDNFQTFDWNFCFE